MPAKLARRRPPDYVIRMCCENGGNVKAAGDAWELYPIFDDSDRRRLKRTCDDVYAAHVAHGRGAVGAVCDFNPVPDLTECARRAMLRYCPAEGYSMIEFDVHQAASEETPADWIAEFEAAARRPLATRMKYAFIHTYKPVLDGAKYRSFDSMEEYRRWCEQNLPEWLGYGRV